DRHLMLHLVVAPLLLVPGRAHQEFARRYEDESHLYPRRDLVFFFDLPAQVPGPRRLRRLHFRLRPPLLARAVQQRRGSAGLLHVLGVKARGNEKQREQKGQAIELASAHETILQRQTKRPGTPFQCKGRRRRAERKSAGGFVLGGSARPWAD